MRYGVLFALVVALAVAPVGHSGASKRLTCLDATPTNPQTPATAPYNLTVGALRFELLAPRITKRWAPDSETPPRYGKRQRYLFKSPLDIVRNRGRSTEISILAPRGAALYYVNSQLWQETTARDVIVGSRTSLRFATNCLDRLTPNLSYLGGVLMPSKGCLRMRIQPDRGPDSELQIPLGVSHC